MKMSFAGALRLIRLQIFILAAVIALHTLSILGVLPPQGAAMAAIQGLFKEHGLPAVAVVSLVENLVGVNVYFPGAIVILAAMSLTGGNVPLAVATFFSIYIPSIVAHLANFGLGRVGGGKGLVETGEAHQIARGAPSWLEFFLALWHPHTAAIVCIRAGSSKMNSTSFLARFIPASLVWNLFWASVMYSYGAALSNSGVGVVVLVYIYLLGWAGLDLWKFSRSVQNN